jgi:hypothetical protein
MQPIRLTDEELSHIFAAATPLAVDRRDGFLQAVAAALASHPDPGPGDVHRAIVAAQKMFFDPPVMSADDPSRKRISGSKYAAWCG